MKNLKLIDNYFEYLNNNGLLLPIELKYPLFSVTFKSFKEESLRYLQEKHIDICTSKFNISLEKYREVTDYEEKLLYEIKSKNKELENLLIKFKKVLYTERIFNSKLLTMYVIGELVINKIKYNYFINNENDIIQNKLIASVVMIKFQMPKLFRKIEKEFSILDKIDFQNFKEKINFPKDVVLNEIKELDNRLCEKISFQFKNKIN